MEGASVLRWKQAKREVAQAFVHEREAAANLAADDKQDNERLVGLIETLQSLFEDQAFMLTV